MIKYSTCAVVFLIVALMLALFGPYQTLAQVPSTERIELQDGFEIRTKYPDGSETLRHYAVRTIDRRKVELLTKSYRSVRDPNTNQLIEYDTLYHKDGITPKAIFRVKYLDSSGVHGRQKQELESREFDRFGNLVSGSSFRSELGFDGKWRIYMLDLNTKQFELEPTYIDGVRVRKTGAKTSYCPAPRSIVSVSYAFTKKDNGFENINYNGVEAGYSYALSRTDYLDTTGVPKSPRVPLSQFAVRILARHLGATTDNGIEAKWNITTVTVGPQFRVSGNRFTSSIFVQAGVAKNTFKLDDIKDNNTCFALDTGLILGWFFGKHIGVQISPQALMTKFNDKSDWNFVGAAGLAWRTGCK